jgi:hypothetical protein
MLFVVGKVGCDGVCKGLYLRVCVVERVVKGCDVFIGGCIKGVVGL